MSSYLLVTDAVLDLAEEMGITRFEWPSAFHDPRGSTQHVELTFEDVRLTRHLTHGWWIRSPLYGSGSTTRDVSLAAKTVVAYYITQSVQGIVRLRGGGMWSPTTSALKNLARLSIRRLGVTSEGIWPGDGPSLDIAVVQNPAYGRDVVQYDALTIGGWLVWDRGPDFGVGKSRDRTFTMRNASAWYAVQMALKFALFERAGIPAHEVPA